MKLIIPIRLLEQPKVPVDKNWIILFSFLFTHHFLTLSAIIMSSVKFYMQLGGSLQAHKKCDSEKLSGTKSQKIHKSNIFMSAH